MIDPSILPLLISLCAAFAAGGLFYIQKVRLGLERPVVKVIKLSVEAPDVIEITIANIGVRAAVDLELRIPSLRQAMYLEGLKAAGEHVFRLSAPDAPDVVILSFRDPYGRRVSEERSFSQRDGRAWLGRPKGVPSVLPAIGTVSTQEGQIARPHSSEAQQLD